MAGYTVSMKWFVAGGGILLLLAIVPLGIEYPAASGAALVAALALWWMIRQGLWRSMYVLVIVTTLGAISSITPWVDISTYGRVVAVAGLLLATYWVTRNEDAVAARGTSRWILTCLALLASFASASVVWSVSIVDTITQAALFIALALCNVRHRAAIPVAVLVRCGGAYGESQGSPLEDDAAWPDPDPAPKPIPEPELVPTARADVNHGRRRSYQPQLTHTRLVHHSNAKDQFWHVGKP